MSLSLPVLEKAVGTKLLTVIVKTTSICNLACDYCYVRPHQNGMRETVIRFETVLKLLHDYGALADMDRGADLDHRAVKITWHGGEPMLAGRAFYERVVEEEHKRIHEPCRTVNSLTTNGVLIDRRWAQFFKSQGFQIGVSLDGPRRFHDTHRVANGGSGTYSDVMSALETLREYDVPFGVLTVVTRESAQEPDAMFDFFVAQGLKNVAFIPYTTLDDWLKPSDYAHFLIRMFDRWFELDDPAFYIRDFANIISKIFGRDGTLCEYNNCFGNYLCLDTNGDLYMCDLLIGNRDMLLGNIHATSLECVMDGERYTCLRCQASAVSPVCSACGLYDVCTGGCLYRRFLGRRTFPSNDIYCGVRKKLIHHILQCLEEIDRDKVGVQTG